HDVLFIMLAPPLKSTLFPYTTLFRSASLNAKATIVRQSVSARRCANDTATSNAIGKWPAETATIAFGTGRATPVSVGARNSVQIDRKSTRLNSSHLGISYAVFCLKKK